MMAGEVQREATRAGTDQAVREPQSASEQYLAALWSEIIGVERVTRGDKFLDLGGNSLTLNVILNRVQTEKGVVLDPEPFFDPEQSSLADLAGHLDEMLAEAK